MGVDCNVYLIINNIVAKNSWLRRIGVVAGLVRSYSKIERCGRHLQSFEHLQNALVNARSFRATN